MVRTKLCLLAVLVAVPACLATEADEREPVAVDEADDGRDGEDEGVGVTDDAIQDGSYANEPMRKRTVDLSTCTGTLISPTHVLTAAHCFSAGFNPMVARAYPTSSFSSDFANPRSRVGLAFPDGVDPGQPLADVIDANLNFADIAVFTLSSPFPSSPAIATMAWKFPNVPLVGYQVGAGNHEDDDNPLGTLLFRTGINVDLNDAGGDFLLLQDHTDGGDSGGPYFDLSYNLLGVLRGGVGQNKYTSVPFHLPWILSQIDFTWQASVFRGQKHHDGQAIDTFAPVTLKVCQYACRKTASCDGYNYNSASDQCTLLSNVGAPGPGGSGDSCGTK